MTKDTQQHHTTYDRDVYSMCPDQLYKLLFDSLQINGQVLLFRLPLGPFVICSFSLGIK